MSTETPPPPVPVFVDFFAGAIGGIAGVIVGHPFDTIKVKLQTMPHPFPGEQAMYTGSLDCAKKVIKREGFFRGLYRGIGPPMLSGTPINAVCFFGYGVGKRLFTSDTHKTLTLSQYFVAGMISGLACVAVMTPAERVKCLLQVQSEDRWLNKDGTARKRFTGSFDCTFKIIKEEGIKGMFRGATITAFREIPGSGGY
ncbi:carnitine-acylcarnitine carrier protein-like protein, partial [Leptotrombidium deliense]